MIEVKIRLPEYELSAAKLAAAKREEPVAQIFRTGNLAYIAYMAGSGELGADVQEALGDLFAQAGRKAAEAWPL